MNRLSLTILSVLLSILYAYNQDAASLYKSGITSFENGDYQKALYYADQTIKCDSSNADYYILRAQTNYELGKYNETIHDCYSSSRLKPRTPEVYLLRAKVCAVTESYGGAVLFFGKTIQNTDNSEILEEAYYRRGMVHMSLGNYEDACDDFKMAITFNEKTIEYQTQLVLAYYELNNLPKASEVNDYIISLHPDIPETYLLKGKIEQQNSNFPDAIAAYKKYCELLPSDLFAHHTLALCYLENNQMEQAWKSLSDAIMIDPNEPISYKTQGIILIKRGDTEKGCNALFKAMQLGYLEKYDYDLLKRYQETCEQ